MAKNGHRGTREKRKSKIRKIKQSILIICEGTETEPNYFKHWKRFIRNEARIEIESKGPSPNVIVDYAVNKISTYDYNQIWCVFDQNGHEGISNSIRKARNNNISVAFSNPCFEIWFLLHFKYQAANIDCDSVCALLKNKYLKRFNKSMDVYDKLLNNQDKAISSAQKLRRKHRHDGTTPVENQNPSTGVDELVEYLNSLPESQ